MAEKDTKTNVVHDDFVGKIVKDPKSPPDTILLTGYLGKSSEEGHTRLYFDPELKSYVEIPNEAILHSQQIPQEQSGLGGSNVWIASDAELIHGKVGPSRTKAKFFEGPIAAGAGGAGAGGAVPLSLTQFNCPSQNVCPLTPLPVCPNTPLHACPSPLCTHVFTQCATPLHGCPPTPLCTQVTQCPTPLHGCPTQVTQCPTPLHGCPTQVTQCPTPLHGCPPPPTPLCTQVTQCPTLFHGCPTPPILCPTPTVARPNCFPTEVPIGCHPTSPQPCQLQTAVNCPSNIGCPSGPVCGGGIAGGGGVEAAHAAAIAILPTNPIACHFTPACPSVFNICPTNPVICHPSPLCPSLHYVCPTQPLICHPSVLCPSPVCPSPVCPSVRVPCETTPGCPIPTAGCPFGGGGGGNPIA